MSTKLTPHFTLEEMTVTKTGLSNIPNDTQTNQLRILCRDVLEPLREKIGQPIIISSAFRSSDVNRAVGGVSTSQHLLGQAADIYSSVQISCLWNAIKSLVHIGSLNIGQCIWYQTEHFIHISLPTKTHKNEFIIRNSEIDNIHF